jgi:hypothetical protein
MDKVGGAGIAAVLDIAVDMAGDMTREASR